MDEEFGSFVVTDPDLVDEGIDVSGLRTQTDVNRALLGNVAPGIQYEGIGFSPTALSDLSKFFQFGLPAIDTAQVPGAIDTLVDTGDGGQATVPGAIDTLVTPSANTPEEQRLIDAGIGVQGAPGDPVVAPGEIPVTQAEIDAFNAPAALDSTSTAEDILKDLSNQQAMLNPTGGNIMDEVALTGTTPIEPGTFTADTLDQSFLSEEGLTENQNNTIKNILTAAGDNVQGALTELGKIPGAIVDFANQTVDVFGKKLNVGKTLAGVALNKLVGGPATLIFELAENILPEGNIAPSTNLARSTGLLQGDNTVTQDIYGINTQTSFDPVQSTKNYNEYNVEQVEDLNNALTNLEEKYEATWNEELGIFTDKKTGLPDKEANDMTNRMRTELKDRKEYLTVAGVGGDVDERDQMLEDIVLQNKIDEGIQAADDDKGSDMLDTATGVNPFKDIDTGVGEFDTTPVDEFSDEAFMVGDTSTAAPTTGDSGADSFFDAVDTATGGGGGPDPSPSFDPGQGFVDTGGGGEFETGPVSTFSAEEEDEIGDDRGGGGGDPGGGPKGCVIATHAVNSGAFTKDTKREAVRWCVKNLHRTWWGEAIRRGYRYYGQKAIEEGKAKNHYQEFKDYIAFGTGKRRTLKTGWTFVYRSIQFFIRGLISG